MGDLRWALVILLAVCTLGKTNGQGRPTRWISKREALKYLTVETQDMKGFREERLNPLLIPRISGTDNNTLVKEHIVLQMRNLGWRVEEDTFEDDTPFGRKRFTNVIATQDVNRTQHIVLACHYDSKDFKTKMNQDFIAATDSAVPCAILLETVKQLDCLLRKGPRAKSVGENLALQLVFFDGEEAFDQWSSTDSLYGARHLAAKWEEQSRLQSIRELILLDLIGTSDTRFISHFPSTNSLYELLMKIEKHLNDNNMLSSRRQQTIFTSFRSGGAGGIEDDHVPFLQRGVDVLHLISTPFPSVWHKMTDDAAHLDFNFIDDFSRIFRVFLANLLHLEPEKLGCRKK